MSAKELNKNLEELFSTHTEETCITYEEIVELFEKAPTAAQVKNIAKHSQKYKKCLFTSSEHAKVLNKQESDARRAAQQKMLEDADGEDFDNHITSGNDRIMNAPNDSADVHSTAFFIIAVRIAGVVCHISISPRQYAS